MSIKINDPLLSQQWHLTRIGVDKIYDQYRGSGVKVGVYDTAIQSIHADLKQNYLTALEAGGNSAGGASHGTAVAGIIAAAANNGSAGVGVASAAGIAGVNIYGAADAITSAMQQLTRFDVVNNSWGWTERYSDGADTSLGRNLVSSLEVAVQNGRGGLGTIVVNAAGNDWQNGHVDANSAEFGASRATITVGAVADTNSVAYYSNRGANLLISAPSSGGAKGIATTDLSGAAGYSSGDSTTTFGGTSAAAPIVAGVVALMLEANPHLGWRDVQDILALSAEHVGSTIGAGRQGGEAYGWTVNHAQTFNGGGMHFSNDYGFGLVDARAAVRMAEIWSNFGAAKVSANESSASASLKMSTVLSDGATTNVSTKIDAKLDVEHVDVTLNLTHADVNQLRIELVSPAGTVSEILSAGLGATAAHTGWNWTFGSEAFRGEDASGTWTVRITDTATGLVGQVQSATVNVFGRAQSANDVYHYTEAFGALAGADPARGALHDADQGFDWLDAAATHSGALIDLEPGAVSGIGGGRVTMDKGTVIEGAIGGDGRDVLIGNAADNTLIGGRGSDYFGFRGAAFGADKILDFHRGEDKIVFESAREAFAAVTISKTAEGCLVSYGPSASIFVAGVDVLDASDFIYGVALAGLAPHPAEGWV